MKTPISISLLLLSILATASLSLLSSCSMQEKKQFVIGISQPCDDAWRQKMNEEMRREQLFHSNITLEFRNSEYDNARQCADIEEFISKGVDLIIVSPNVADALTNVVSKAYNSGIPVIVADRSVNGDDYTAFIAGDNRQVSRLMGDYVIANMPNGGKILELKGLPNASPAIQRHETFSKMIGTMPNFEIVESINADWQWSIADHIMDSLLHAGVVVDMVVAQNDQMAMGARAAADRYFGRENNKIRFLGVDAMTGEGNGIDAIIDGRLEASFLYSSGGDKIIRLAMNILEGESYERLQILPSAVINRQSAEAMDLMAQETEHEVETIKMLKGKVDEFWHQHNLERTLLYTLLILFIMVLVIIAVLYRNYNMKVRMNARLAQHRTILEERNRELKKVTRQLEEATRAKLMFFTNVSHDFRTPLTLISAPIEKLQETEGFSPQQRQLLSLANKNVQVLLRLINQILDFRKYESGKLTLNLQTIDLANAVRNWLESFNGLALNKHIKLSINCNNDPVLADQSFVTQVDVQKIERVFFNIMGNAFKFTPENGSIRITLRRDGGNIVMSIADSGRGLQVEHINHIFDNFYQIDSVNYEGSGIGLAVVKSFIELHGGTIVASNLAEGTGAVFTITLPVSEAAAIPDSADVNISAQQVQAELGEVEQCEEIAEDEPLPVALVIDDNADVREMMRTLLADKYKVITASNGQEGLRRAMMTVPNVIICDVMMPVMDGLECCRRLKAEICTSHIPVLMLTACSLDEQRVQGHKEGADAYLPKPFSSEVLIAQLDALVSNHDRIRDFFGDMTIVSAKKPEQKATQEEQPQKEVKNTDTPDEKFLRKMRAIIEEKMGDSDFNVENLGDEIGMSRAQLYRKAKALTNYSPVELIRNTRLKKARQLLAQGEMNISQVAYEVGFTAPSYFTKCYKEFFGEMPNEMLK